MKPNPSRRNWLLGMSVMAASASEGLLGMPQIFAQSPAAWDSSDASQAVITNTQLPVQSRAVRLTGDAGQRVVVTAIAVDPRGELIAASGDDLRIRILRSSNMEVMQTFGGHRDVIRTLTFDPAGDKLVSAGNDGQLIIWGRAENFAAVQTMANTPALARVRFAPDGSEMAAVGFDNAVYVIGRRARRPVMQCDCRDLRAVAYREDLGMIVSAGRSGELHRFDFDTGRSMGDQKISESRIHDIVFHRSSNIAVCVSEDGFVNVVDTNTNKRLHRIEVTTGKLFAVAVINSHLVAVAGSDNDIRIVDTDAGRVVRTLKGHRGSVSTLASGGDALFSGSYDATLRRWEIADIALGQERIARIPNAGNSDAQTSDAATPATRVSDK